MKKNLIILFLFVSFLLACAEPTPPSPTEERPTEVAFSPQLELSVDSGGPNQPFIVQGEGFPVNQIVVVYYAESETNLGPAVAQALTSNQGSFQIELLIPTSWPGADFRGETRLRIVAETTDDPVMASAPLTIEYDGALQQYENRSAGYALDIPSGWGTTEPQITPLGEVVLMGPEPISPGSPSNSTIIATSLDQLDDLSAAQSLICGEPGCTEDVVFNLVQINGREAKSVMVGSEETAFLEWFFITFEDRLVYFSLHDPLTLEPIDPLVQTFTLIEPASASAEEPTEEAVVAQVEESTNTPEPTITPTPILQATDTPTAESTPTITPTPILQPTNTPAVTPTPTLEPTPTIVLELADPSSIGPLQTSLDLLTILSVSAENRETLLYLTEAAQESVESPDDIQDFLKLSRTPFAFQAERIQGVVPPVVRVFVQFYVNSPTETIDLEMVQEEGRWRVNAARLVLEDPPPPTEEAAPVEGEEAAEEEPVDEE